MKTHHTDQEIQAAVDAAFRAATSLAKLSTSYGSAAWDDEAEDRLDVAKLLLARLPEPTPPVVDGKTPGQVCHESMYNTPEWKWLLAGDKAACENAASAVLAAFGQGEAVDWKAKYEEAITALNISKACHEKAELTESSNTLTYVSETLDAMRIGPGSIGIEQRMDKALECKARAENAAKAAAEQAERATRFEAKLQKVEAEIGNLLAVIHRDGGHYEAEHGTKKAVKDARKVWIQLVKDKDKAEAEIADAHNHLDQLGFSRGNGEDEFTLKGRLADLKKCSLPQLRPIEPKKPDDLPALGTSVNETISTISQPAYVGYMTPAEEIPWTEWHGGECPLDDNEVEEWQWKLRDETVQPACAENKGLFFPSGRKWNHIGNRLDIIAYRVLRWKKKPNPETFEAVSTLAQDQTELTLSLRDWFAGQVMPVVYSARDCLTYATGETIGQGVARNAYQLADAMIAAREAKP